MLYPFTDLWQLQYQEILRIWMNLLSINNLEDVARFFVAHESMPLNMLPRRSFASVVKHIKEQLEDSEWNNCVIIGCEDGYESPTYREIYQNIILSYYPKERKRLLGMVKINLKFLPNLHINGTDKDILKKYPGPRL